MLHTESLKQGLGNLFAHPLILVYRPESEFIENDEVLINAVVDSIDAHPSDVISLILSGDGGHFGPALNVAVHLRNKFHSHVDTYIPAQASSAMVYIALLSNRLYACNDAPLSQCDLIFSKDGTNYQARAELQNADPVIRSMAHSCWSKSGDLLRAILSYGHSLFERDLIDSDIPKIMDELMRSSLGHRTPIRVSKLISLGFNIERVTDDVLKRNIEKTYDSAIASIKEKDARFVVGTDKVLIYG